MKLLSFDDFLNESKTSKTMGKLFYQKMKKLNDQVESLKEVRKERVKPFNLETDPEKKDEIKKDLVSLTTQINNLENQLQKMRATELDFIQNLDRYTELELSEKIANSEKYSTEFAKQFTTYLNKPVIGKWTLNLSSLENDGIFVWQNEGIDLYANPFLNGEEQIEFSLIKNSDEIILKEIGLSKKVYLKLTQNYLLDVKNYIKEVEKYIKNLNKFI